MTLADDLKPILYSVRSIPGSLGLRPYRVFFSKVTSLGAHTGDANGTEAEVEITEADGQPPRVRFFNREERALGGLADGSAQIGPVTPNHTGGGTSLATLNGSDLDAGDVLYVRLLGPGGSAYYRVTDIRDDKALHWLLTVEPVSAAGGSP